jgi:uncharacterized membrane protein
MAWFKATSTLDRTFEVGIILKGIDGTLELIGGLLLLTISHDTINRVAVLLTQSELSEDPHDFIANYLIAAAHHLTVSTQLYGAIYLLSHGIIKIVLVTAVLKQKIWAYPWLIVFLLVFIVYQTYRLTFAPTFGLAALTVFDIFITWLTYLEYKQHKADWPLKARDE